MGLTSTGDERKDARDAVLEGENEIVGKYFGFDHVHFWVGNAVQAAAFYISRLGFAPLAYRSLENGSRDVMTQVVSNGSVVFAFSSALEPNNTIFARHLALRGDGVRDVAFSVDCAQSMFENAMKNGARSVSPPTTLSDTYGSVVTATIEAPYDGTLHTFIERTKYRGPFLPGFESLEAKGAAEPLLTFAAPPELSSVDHCVCNVPEGQMESTVAWYTNVLGFRRFWSVDDSQILTKYSSLRSVVVTDRDEVVKMPVNEPAAGLRKSQIEEFLDYYGGSGIQHVALRTENIIRDVARLRSRGVSFIVVPDTYYEDLRERLRVSPVEIEEDLDELQRLGLLVDHDEQGYLLQIFTRPVQDRPTFFIEILQRRTHNGFGLNNFKSLFEAIERDQALRGNL